MGGSAHLFFRLGDRSKFGTERFRQTVELDIIAAGQAFF